jgi:single-stranded DNA-binding protein
VKRYTTEVVADQMQMLGGRSAQAQDDAPKDKLKEPTPGAGDFDDSGDIPF